MIIQITSGGAEYRCLYDDVCMAGLQKLDSVGRGDGECSTDEDDNGDGAAAGGRREGDGG